MNISILWLSFIVLSFPNFVFFPIYIFLNKWNSIIFAIGQLFISLFSFLFILLSNTLTILNFSLIFSWNINFKIAIFLIFALIIAIFINFYVFFKTTWKKKSIKFWEIDTKNIVAIYISTIAEEFIYDCSLFLIFLNLLVYYDKQNLLYLYVLYMPIIFTLNHMILTKNIVDLIGKLILGFVLASTIIISSNILFTISIHITFNTTFIFLNKGFKKYA